MSKSFKISKILRLAVLSTLLCCAGCHKPNGTINLNFSFVNDNDSLLLDSCIYRNAAGNLYEVNDVQYFISKVMLVDENGSTLEISDNQGIHYVDIRIPSTLTWRIPDEIPTSNYQSISFVFGLEGAQNVTGYFPNPPENNMSWPDMLGGGYHYMKINGRWIDDASVRQPFNLHTGKISNGNSFSDNTFRVTLPLEQFTVSKEQTSSITLQMNINAWFSDPYLFDFNEFGGSIMQNREAQKALRANGYNVFSVRCQ
jgi:hypothetical protein